MPYIVAILQHDFLGKIELMSERKTLDEVRQIAVARNPFAVSTGKPDESEREENYYSAIIFEGTLDSAHEGKLGKPIAFYYRGVEWTP